MGGWLRCRCSALFPHFNPIVQGEKFDPLGEYVHLGAGISPLTPAFIHKPWQAPKGLLAQCGIKLGEDYPHPLVNHEEAGEIAWPPTRLFNNFIRQF